MNRYPLISPNPICGVFFYVYPEYTYIGDGYTTTDISNLEPVTGNNLLSKVDNLADSTVSYSDLCITSQQRYVVTTDDPSETEISMSSASTVSAFPINVDIDISSPLIENPSYTVWFGMASDGKVDCSTVQKSKTYDIADAADSISVPMDTFASLYRTYDGYSAGGYSQKDVLKKGVTIIQLDSKYKTFDIPVRNATFTQEKDEYDNDKKISVTKDETGYLDTENDSFYLCYIDKANSVVKVTDAAISTKSELWTAIETFATVINSTGTVSFDESNLVLCRYAQVEVYGDTVTGEFTSKDLFVNTTAVQNTALLYLFNSSPKSIWKIKPSSGNPFYSYQESMIGSISDYLLDNPHENILYLYEKPVILVTGEDLSTIESIPDSSPVTSKLIKKGATTKEDTQRTISDHLSDLAESYPPDAGKTYDVNGWQVWGYGVSCGDGMLYKNFTPIEVTRTDIIGLEQFNQYLEAAGDRNMLLSFPQVEIAPVLEVTAPVASETLSSEYTIKDTIGGYTVADVSWYDGETKLNESDKFEAGKQYTVKITLSAPSKFTEDTIVTINGENASTELCENGDLIAAYTYDIPATPIAIAEIIIDEPTLNGVPDTTFDKHSDAHFTASAASWSPDDDKFEAGKKYTVTATLTPDVGYGFTNDTVFKINGKTVTPTNKDGIWSVSYTFDELKAEPWWDIDEILEGENPSIIISMDNPTIPQSVFEKIKNSGKTVTINYDNGYSWEIDGSTIVLSKVPAGGVDLSIVTVDPNDWATVVNKVTGHKYRMQIDIAHEGDFGFTAILTVNLTEGMRNAPAGTYYANLYQIIGNRLVWSGYSPVTQNENGEWIAKLQFTHASEWLITIDDEINPATGNSSSSGGSSYRPVTETKAAKTAKSEGWSNITNEIKAAQTGSTIEITLNDDTTIPEEALQAAIDNKVKLVIDVGLGRTWTIDGAKAVSGKYIDLTVSGASVDIPAEAYKNIPCSSSNQLIINSRMLNFTAQLSDSVGKNKAGQNAAIYLYNEETGRLLFQELSVVDEDGNITFDVYCGGRYFIALGSEVNAENYQCGDANGDGVVDIFDASAILKNDVFGSVIDKRCADTNCDGKVNVFDASLILKYVVEIVKALPVSAA